MELDSTSELVRVSLNLGVIPLVGEKAKWQEGRSRSSSIEKWALISNLRSIP